MRDLILSVAVTCIHRGLLLRNRLWKLPYPVYDGAVPRAAMERCTIAVGEETLDACLAVPCDGRAMAAVLILHGIGETVEHWGAVQQIFAGQGVASLVVDYRGFGQSSGWFSTDRAEADALAAVALLRTRFPQLRLSLVGFSLGSGLAAAVWERAGAEALALCAGYPSLRKAARSVGVPRWMTMLMRDIWRTDEVLRTVRMPVVLVHGAEDRLFPPALARELAAECPSAAELFVVTGVSHDDPIFRPSLLFWDPVIRRATCGDDL